MPDLAALIAAAAASPGAPLAVATVDAEGRLAEDAAGAWADGQLTTTHDRFYGASLAKPVTGAALALLVVQGQLDPDRPLSQYLAGLPAWADIVTARHLAHHVAGLPEAGVAEAAIAGNWTEGAAMAYLAGMTEVLPPLSAYRYSNLGYIVLARLVAAFSGMSLAAFADAQLQMPDGMELSQEPSRFRQGAAFERKPMTLGDGGLWTTAAAYARWLDMLNRDPLAIAEQMTADIGCSDRHSVGYGWGIGLRWFRGHRLYIHGGQWEGATAKALRCPALGLSVVVLASGVSMAATSAVADAALERLADG